MTCCKHPPNPGTWAHIAAKHCPNDVSQSEFSGARKDCFLCFSIWKRPWLLLLYRRLGKLESKENKNHLPASAGGCNTVEWEWNTSTSSSSEHKTNSYFSVQKRATDPDPTGLVCSLYKCQSLSPLPHLSTELKPPSSRATGRALVHMSFLLDASVGCYTQQEVRSFTLLSYSCWAEKCPTARMKQYATNCKPKMQDGASCTEPHLTLYPLQQFQTQCGILACW